MFTRSGGVWAQQGGKLTGIGESGPGGFGWSVALSSDGNTALVGSPFDNVVSKIGAAWVFTRSGATWTQQGAKLTGSTLSAGAWFGWSVALSGDGNTVLVGGFPDLSTQGAAWVFTRSGSAWSQQARLTDSGFGGSYFGWSVSLSGDGNTALVGGPTDIGEVGAAWVFARLGTTWTQQGAKLTGSGESGAGDFGYDVALSADGNTALIGGPRDNSNAGAAWVFTGPATVPAAPSNLTATALSRSQIGLTWTDNATGEIGFTIERSFDGSSGWRQIGTVAANVTTYTHSRQRPLTAYYYRVRATYAVGGTGYSNVASATTLG